LYERDACVTCKSPTNVSTWLVYTQMKWWTDAYDLISFISVGVAGLISLPPLHIDAFMIVPYIYWALVGLRVGVLIPDTVDTYRDAQDE